MINKGYSFIFLLLIIFFILFFIRKISSKYKQKKKYSKKFIRNLGYGYIFFYSVIAGILVYIGLEDLKDLINTFVNDKSLSCLIGVTFLITFCFIYAAFFKDILENIFDNRIKIDEWDNVKGYLLGRITVIFIIYFIINKLLRNK